MVEAYELITKVFREEKGLLRSTKLPDRFDLGLFETFHKVQDTTHTIVERFDLIRRLLNVVQWKMNIQKCFFIAFINLLKHGKLSPACVDNPIKFHTANSAVHTLSEVIQCFEVGAECGPRGSVNPSLRRTLKGRLDSATIWFATAILRSNVDPNEVLRHHTIKKHLGNFDEKHRESIPTDNKEVFEDEVESYPNTVPQLFFLLPNGINGDMKEWALKASKRWNSWKYAYEAVYGPGSCIQDDEVLEIFEGYIDNEADK